MVMGEPSFWGVAGKPISHSPTPLLFSIVAEILGVEQAEKVYIEASDMGDFLDKTSEMQGDLWVSCTSPLKHLAPESLDVSGPEGVGAVNQLMRSGGQWFGCNTDGRGFVRACRHIGIDPKGSTLRMRGGGSAARSIAQAWSSEGGYLIPVTGRRALTRGTWYPNILDSGHANIAVDLDAAPAGGQSLEMDADTQVSVSYSSGESNEEFAVIMLVAQHLEAWRTLFAPSRASEIPDLEEVLSRL